jgi:hypothetical protein
LFGDPLSLFAGHLRLLAADLRLLAKNLRLLGDNLRLFAGPLRSMSADLRLLSVDLPLLGGNLLLLAGYLRLLAGWLLLLDGYLRSFARPLCSLGAYVRLLAGTLCKVAARLRLLDRNLRSGLNEQHNVVEWRRSLGLDGQPIGAEQRPYGKPHLYLSRGPMTLLRESSNVSDTRDIVQKLRNLCNVLRGDGIKYLQYVTELTYLLFLKMMKETGKGDQFPEGHHWDAHCRP